MPQLKLQDKQKGFADLRQQMLEQVINAVVPADEVGKPPASTKNKSRPFTLHLDSFKTRNSKVPM